MRHLRILTALIVALTLIVPSAGCKQKMVTVRDGEIVLCTEGEVVSDTTEELEVPAKEVGEYEVTTRVITCDLHTKLAALYDEARAALEKGDTESARKALADLVALDPTYRDAGQQLASIDKGVKPPADPGDDTGTPTTPGNTPGDDAPTGPVLNLIDYTPDRVTGFVGQGLIADPFVLTRDYLPESPGDIDKLVIVAEQFKDAAAAKAELQNAVKANYAQGAAQVNVGSLSGYFGYRGSTGAIAFVDGAILVVVEAAAYSGSASAFKTTLTSVAEEIAP